MIPIKRFERFCNVKFKKLAENIRLLFTIHPG